MTELSLLYCLLSINTLQMNLFAQVLVVLFVLSMPILVCFSNFFCTHKTESSQLTSVRARVISIVLCVLNKHISSESTCVSACAALHTVTLENGKHLISQTLQ